MQMQSVEKPTHHVIVMAKLTVSKRAISTASHHVDSESCTKLRYICHWVGNRMRCFIPC